MTFLAIGHWREAIDLDSLIGCPSNLSMEDIETRVKFCRWRQTLGAGSFQANNRKKVISPLQYMNNAGLCNIQSLLQNPVDEIVIVIKDLYLY